MKIFKLGKTDGTSLLVETPLTMLELANVLRSQQKVRLSDAEGRAVNVESGAVRYIEHEYSVPKGPAREGRVVFYLSDPKGGG